MVVKQLLLDRPCFNRHSEEISKLIQKIKAKDPDIVKGHEIMKMQRNNFWEVFNILPGLAENPSLRSQLYQISYSSSIGLVKDIAFIIDLVYIIL